MVSCILRYLCQSISLPFFSNGHYPFLTASQSDNLLSYLTVEETLTFTAQLALRQHSASAIRKKVISTVIVTIKTGNPIIYLQTHQCMNLNHLLSMQGGCCYDRTESRPCGEHCDRRPSLPRYLRRREEEGVHC